MKLYNTLTRKIETFTPQDPDQVNFYSCGPTVYDYYHIGNLRNAIFNDSLRRVLEASGYKTKHVMNITDVGHLVSDSDEGEDKLEKGALREGKTVWEVAEHYTKAFKEDMGKINVLPPNGYHSAKYNDSYARATEFIPQQIEIIKILIEKGFAYVTSQAIYFEVEKLDDYGQLSGQSLKDKEVGARKEVVTDDSKKSPHDFAVWFFTTGRFADHSMHWESPWGNGFPGWHLECSAIIHAVLGEPLDIHTGGVDHIGTHHPNEIAQTKAAFNKPLSKFWVHNEFILVDGAKMSKSKHNSYLLKDILNKGFTPLAYRLMVLQAHYRSELNFSWENLEAAQNRLHNYRAMADLVWQPVNSNDQPDPSQVGFDFPAILESVQDDLNTPQALALLSNLSASLEDKLITADDQQTFREFLKSIDALLGLKLSERQDITEAQKDLIKQRSEARASKDWDSSDKIRDQLSEQGVFIRDTDHGPIWSREIS